MAGKVSIVTVTFNCESVVEATITSVLGQTYENKELIVIDGNSTDTTVEIVHKYKRDIAVLISEDDEGIFSAMNKGISVAKGDWIIFMNAGDTFVSSETLSDNSGLLFNKSVGVIYSSHLLKFKNSKRLIDDIPFFNQKGRYRTMGFSHQSCLVRLDLAQKWKFSLDFKLTADYNMLYSIYKNEDVLFKKALDPIAVMDDNGGATISNYKLHLIEECEIAGYSQSVSRMLFVEVKYLEFRFKRIVKRFLFK